MQVEMLVGHDDPEMETWAILADELPPEPWYETFDLSCNACWDAPDGMDAMGYAKHVVKFFNDTLKPGESKRKVISAKFVMGE